MNTTQRKLLELLVMFNSICVNNNIKYSLHGGTLLGAVREKGFIEWDDDVDIALSRFDYNNLVDFLRNNKINNIKYDYSKNPYKMYLENSDDSIWLDMFVYDYISINKIGMRMKILLEDIFMTFLKNEHNLATTKAKWSYPKYLLIKFVSIVGKLFSDRFKKKTLYFVREKMFCGNKQYVHRSNDHHGGRLEILPSSIFDNYLYVKFEDASLMIFTQYKKVLIASYGENYMIPIKPDKASLLGHELTRCACAEKKNK